MSDLRLLAALQPLQRAHLCRKGEVNSREGAAAERPREDDKVADRPGTFLCHPCLFRLTRCEQGRTRSEVFVAEQVAADPACGGASASRSMPGPLGNED